MNSENSLHTRTRLIRAVVRRSWPVLVSCALVGGLGGGFAGSTVDDPRTAVATILLNPLSGNAFYPSARGELLANLATEAQVLQSDSVAKEVASATASGESVDQLLKAVTVAVPANTQILEISYTDRNPKVALTGAQGFADAYLAYRRDRAASSVSGLVDGIKTEVAKHSADLTALTNQLAATPPGSAAANLLNVQIQSVSSQITQLSAQMSDQSTTPLDPGQVITPAKLDRPALLGYREIMAGLGMLAGVLLGLLFVLYKSRPKGRIRSAGEIQAFSINTLATVPATGGSQWATTAGHSKAAGADSSYLQFRAQVLGLIRNHRNQAILVTSSSAEVNHPLSIVRLAESLAAAEIHTVVIDATGELALPRGVTASPTGLADLLRERVPAENALVRLGPHLQVIGAGRDLEEERNLFASPRMAELVLSLNSNADVVLVAARSIAYPDVQALADTIRSVVIEIQYGRSNHGDLRAAVDICDGLSVDLLGALVLRPATRTGGHHSAAYPAVPAPATAEPVQTAEDPAEEGDHKVVTSSHGG